MSHYLIHSATGEGFVARKVRTRELMVAGWSPIEGPCTKSKAFVRACIPASERQTEELAAQLRRCYADQAALLRQYGAEKR